MVTPRPAKLDDIQELRLEETRLTSALSIAATSGGAPALKRTPMVETHPSRTAPDVTPDHLWSGVSGTIWSIGAWLAPVEHFIAKLKELPPKGNPESATFNFARELLQSSLQTNDALDLAIVHLSVYTRVGGMEDEGHVAANLTAIFKRRLIDQTEEIATTVVMSDLLAQQRTVAIVPYVGRAFRQRESQIHDPLRELMLNATFCSVRQRFPRVVLATCTAQDATVASRVPFWRTLVMEDDVTAVGGCKNLYVWAMHAFGRFLASRTETDVDYVYFTEPDQVLVVRNLQRLYGAIKDGSQRNILVPHRFHAVPTVEDMEMPLSLYKDYPKVTRWLGTEVVSLPFFGASCCYRETVSLNADYTPDNVPPYFFNPLSPGSPPIRLMRLGSHGLPFVSVMEFCHPGSKQPRFYSCVPSARTLKCNPKPTFTKTR